jgi:hypothetical protein
MLFCDIRTSNVPSINNVIEMGYRQITRDGVPLILKPETIRGLEDWYRYQITRSQILLGLPGLVRNLARRYWTKCSAEICRVDDATVEQVFRISSVQPADHYSSSDARALARDTQMRQSENGR